MAMKADSVWECPDCNYAAMSEVDAANHALEANHNDPVLRSRPEEPAIPRTTPLQLADRLVDALDRAGCVPGVAGLENKMRRVLAEELERAGGEVKNAEALP